MRRHKLGVLASAAAAPAPAAGSLPPPAGLHGALQVVQALAARALAEQHSREAIAQRNRAEEQTARAIIQQELAERQRLLAEGRLNDVHALADSMLFEISDDVKDLAGGTKAREALLRLGQQYLNKEAAATRLIPAAATRSRRLI